ncbi:MAG: hypothetical protein O2958_14975 [Gemmatimonadetes bacterium]|nr:hypothetical protein [Gemmatimonadota bacterium]MDA1104551.1 hypothetical protein [Gemmatimonadota bacterium]
MRPNRGTANWMLVALLALSAVPVRAQIEPGRVYSGGEQISDPDSGLRLTLPAGWRGGLSQDGESFVLEPDAGDGYLVVVGDEITEADARLQLSTSMDLGGGVVLTPNGAIENVASGHLSARYAVTGAPADMVGVVDVRLTQSGLAVAFILLSPPASAAGHLEAMRQFAFSLGVVEAVVQTTGAGDLWEPFLRGMYLARYHTATGYTESTELWLCSNGVFYYNSQGGGFGGGASGAVQTTDGGRWSATGGGATGTLLLQWSNGQQSSMSLEYNYDDSRVFVNGDHMLQGKNERCQ